MKTWPKTFNMWYTTCFIFVAGIETSYTKYFFRCLYGRIATAVVTGTSLIERFIEVNNGCERAFSSWYISFPSSAKAAKYEIQHCNIVSLQVFVDVSRFSPGVINLTRNKIFVAGWRNAASWLVDFQVTSKLVARQVVSLMKNEQQSQNLLLKVDPLSTFCNNFLQPATNDKLITQGEKRETSERFDVYGQRQTAKIKLLPSVFSSLYSRIKLFVFAVNSKRHFSIFVWFILR